MTHAKYIKFRVSGSERIHVFPDDIQHSEEAERIGLPPVSAGFVNRGRCFGESLSMRLKSEPEADTALLNAGLLLTGEVAA